MKLAHGQSIDRKKHEAMKIGIDARLISGRHTGDRTYWRGLIDGLRALPEHNEYLLYFRNTPPDHELSDLDGRFALRIVPSPNERIWSQAAFPMALKRDKTDLAHVQYTVPLMSTVPVVTTIADITFKLFPELFTFKDRTLLNLSIPASIKRSAAVICVSENTRNDILKAYPDTPSNKAIAIHNGIGSEFTPASVEDIAMFRDRVKEQYNIDGDYVLSVGVLQPRKNAPLLIRAFLKAKADGNLPHRLVIVGKRGWLSDQTEKAIADAGENVIFAGYAADDDLRALYCCADCLAYPSLYEGFGLPPAEAMACGCPVIAGNTSSLPEVVGDAGLLVDPKNQDAWSEALVCLLTDARLRETLAQKGLRQVKRFSWITAAQKTLLVYRSVLEKA